MTVAGALFGVALALALLRTLRGLLFAVTPTDPMTFAAVVAVLLAVAIVACYIPARRAMILDPTHALRTQ